MPNIKARAELGASDALFKKVYQSLKARDVIEYIKNDLNIHRLSSQTKILEELGNPRKS